MAVVIFLPVLFYPPMLFIQKIWAPLRISLFVVLTIYLLASIKKLTRKDIVFAVILGCMFTSFVFVNLEIWSDLVTACSVTLTLLFAYALSRAVETNPGIKDGLITFYANFFKLVPICSLLSVVYLHYIGEYNLFNIDSGGQQFFHTPFGTILEKGILGISTYRSSFYFYEPVYLGLFYAANIFLVAPKLKEKSNIFYLLNIAGGVLTFSYFFFGLSAILYLVSTRMLDAKYLNRKILLIFAIITAILLGVLSSSSMSDRLYRIDIFFSAIERMSLLDWMFGRGFSGGYDFEKSISAGFFIAIYENGIVTLTLLMLFTALLTNRNKNIFVLFCCAMLVFEPTKLPLFWILIVVLVALFQERRPIKQNGGLNGGL